MGASKHVGALKHMGVSTHIQGASNNKGPPVHTQHKESICKCRFLILFVYELGMFSQ